jgi:acetyl esterase/lipase
LNKVWLVFIHGGAWCDPEQTCGEIEPALKLLLQSTDNNRKKLKSQEDEASMYARILGHIAGFASINYGLSPKHGDASDDPARQKRHPDHLQDVIKAMDWLRREYDVGVDKGKGGWDYIVMGHSCGATILFQLVMGLISEGGESGFGKEIEKPVALVGLEGLYDLPLLVRNHQHEPYYRAFVESAFGENEEFWREVSPVNGVERYVLEGVRTIVLGMSKEDELVEYEQVQVMNHKLQDLSQSDERQFRFVELSGGHDECWSQGVGIIKALAVTIEALFGDKIFLN